MRTSSIALSKTTLSTGGHNLAWSEHVDTTDSVTEKNMATQTRSLLECLAASHPTARVRPTQCVSPELLSLEGNRVIVTGFCHPPDPYAKTKDRFLILGKPGDPKLLDYKDEGYDYVFFLDRGKTPWLWTLLRLEGSELMVAEACAEYTLV